MKIQAFCTGCKCKGYLYKRKKDGGVTFVPLISTKSTHIYKQNRRSWLRIESHGFGTLQQKASLVIWGSLFWIAVMLVANFMNYERTKFKPGIGSHCVLKYKKCIVEYDWNLCASSMYDCANPKTEGFGYFNFTAPEKKNEIQEVILETYSMAENKANANLCHFNAHLSKNLCTNLCYSADFSYHVDENFEVNRTKDMLVNPVGENYNQEMNSECNNICMLAADIDVKDDCPFEKRCPHGCPCPGYDCQKHAAVNDLVIVSKNLYSGTRRSKSLYKVAISPSFKFEELSSEISQNTYATFCIVPFRGNFYVIEAIPSLTGKVTILVLYKVDEDGSVKKISEDYPKFLVVFGIFNKICASGFYQKDDERIMFCSSDHTDVCHSYKIKENSVSLITINNRPYFKKTSYNYNSYYDNIYGLRFEDKLTMVNLAGYDHDNVKSVEITTFDGREKSGHDLWVSRQYKFPSHFSKLVFNLPL